MRYTIQKGVVHPFSERVNDNLRYILPLLVVLAGALFFVLTPHHTSKKATPMTLGIYTVHTPAATSSKPGGNNNNAQTGSSSSPSLSGALPTATYSPQSTSSLALDSAPVAPASSSSYVPTDYSAPASTTTSGGLGGGDTSTSGGTSTPAGTVVCTGTLLTATVCTACTPPVSLTLGQKAILNSDGTCTVVDP